MMKRWKAILVMFIMSLIASCGASAPAIAGFIGN